MNAEEAQQITTAVVEEIEKAVVGQREVIEQMVAALLAGGHALLEGVPGTAKTLIVRCISRALGASFHRIQFTPDLMPTDIIGVNTYNTTTGEFSFRPGPIFADVILGDEINRAPAKTQSALLEAMQEKQVTVDGVTRDMSDIFSVFATQNPVELEGTYPLPEAQVDRFMVKVLIDYPGEGVEDEMLGRVEEGFDSHDLSTAGIEKVLDVPTLRELRTVVRSIHVEEDVRNYITTIVRATRSLPASSLGASPRACVMLLLASKARAVMNQRSYVTPDDVKLMALPVLRHRVLLRPEVEVEGRTTDECIEGLLRDTEVPR